eukprot:10553352-Alexandrium_andersonii.AAC.1
MPPAQSCARCCVSANWHLYFEGGAKVQSAIRQQKLRSRGSEVAKSQRDEFLSAIHQSAVCAVLCSKPGKGWKA